MLLLMYLRKLRPTFIVRCVLQLPWIKHGQDVVADSRFIIKYLQYTYGSKLQEPQDKQSQAISTLVQRMCEEHMYFTSQYHRMVNPQVPTLLCMSSDCTKCQI